MCFFFLPFLSFNKSPQHITLSTINSLKSDNRNAAIHFIAGLYFTLRKFCICNQLWPHMHNSFSVLEVEMVWLQLSRTAACGLIVAWRITFLLSPFYKMFNHELSQYVTWLVSVLVKILMHISTSISQTKYLQISVSDFYFSNQLIWCKMN